MNSQYQPQPGQYPPPQNTQPTQTPNATGAGATYGNHRHDNPQAPAAAYTSGLSTSTTTQQYTVPQYPQQPPQYFPPVGPFAMGAAYQQSSATGTNHVAHTPYIQNQRSSMVPEPQMYQQPPVLQPQQSQQCSPQYHTTTSSTQHLGQSLHIAHQQPPISQQPQQPPAIDFT